MIDPQVVADQFAEARVVGERLRSEEEVAERMPFVISVINSLAGVMVSAAFSKNESLGSSPGRDTK